MKKLAMLLAVCLLLSTLPAAALSEALENEFVEEIPAEAVGRTDAPGLIADPGEDARAEGSEDGPPVQAAEDAAPVPQPVEAAEAAAPDGAAQAVDDGAASDAGLPEASAPLDGARDDAGETDGLDGEYAVAPPLPDEGEAATPQASDGDTVESQPGEAAVPTPGLPPHTDPNGPQLAANDILLGVGETFELKGAMPAGREGGIAYASADEAVATVSEDGVVTALAYGDVRLTATADDGTYAECDVHVRCAPESVSFGVASFSLGKGESYAGLVATLSSPAGECAGACTYATSNKKIVTVDQSGVIKGKKTGKAVITVTTYNGLKASCSVSVMKAPGKLTLSVKKCTLGVGQTGQLDVKLPRKSASQLSYLSEAPSIVAVDASGAIQAVGVGTTRVRVSSFNKKKAYMTVTVLPAPQALSFPAPEVALGVGMNVAVTASVDVGAAPAISYAIADSAVAALQGGKVRGVAAGETEITATTYNGLSATCKLTVKPAPQYVRMPYKTVTLGVGESMPLQLDVGDSVGAFTFKNSAKRMVSVSSTGVIKALKKGSATITVKTYNNKSCKLKVVVQKGPTSLKLSQTVAEMSVGETLRLTDSFIGTTYRSADPNIAAVDADSGEVTALAPGAADIVATAPNGREARCAVTVFDVPEWIDTDANLLTLAQGEERAIAVELSPGSRSPLRFISQNPVVATVSADGVIRGVNSGTTTVTVETNVPGVTAQVQVTVLPAPVWVELEVVQQTLNVHETCQMVPVIPSSSATLFSYASSDEKVATVSEEGAVLAVGKGTAALTVTTLNGLSATLQLTVLDPWYPETATLVNAPGILKKGQSVQLEYALTPDSAVADFEWVSSNPAVASVSGDGYVTAVAFGYAKITATSKKNSALKLELSLAVEADNVVLTIPARTTDIAGIPANLAKIEAIRAASIGQINAMRSGGVISEADAAARRSIVNNAFKDYAFPWMTPAYQAYWKAANSEGGIKDFQPGHVYYGLPYISGSGTNRQYNVEKALAEARYTYSGDGYYLLNQKNLLNKKYCGNDCSGFVDAAIWGNKSSHSSDRTTDIAKSKAYKTIKGFASMRAGDLICKSSSHVVMFLYYASADRSKIMIIENGGSEPGTNTVHCCVMDVSYYKKKGYKVRRHSDLG